MKLPLNLKKWATKKYELTKMQQLAVIGLIGIASVAITVIYTNDSEVAVQPLPPNNSSKENINKQDKQLFSIKQSAEFHRDPFALPPENKQPEKNQNPSPEKNDNFSSKASPPIPNHLSSMPPQKPLQQENFRLTGIVDSADNRLAVIMSKNKSKPYGLDEMIGEYKIAVIGNEYVILTSGNREVMLRLEPDRHKGGSK